MYFLLRLRPWLVQWIILLALLEMLKSKAQSPYSPRHLDLSYTPKWLKAKVSKMFSFKRRAFPMCHKCRNSWPLWTIRSYDRRICWKCVWGETFKMRSLFLECVLCSLWILGCHWLKEIHTSNRKMFSFSRNSSEWFIQKVWRFEQGRLWCFEGHVQRSGHR